MELSCDVLVVGGGCGGVAAALAASDMGRLVVLTEAGSRVGGQLTGQAVPPDEHPWVETTGITARYRQLRESVRTRYQQTRRLTEQARQQSARRIYVSHNLSPGISDVLEPLVERFF